MTSTDDTALGDIVYGRPMSKRCRSMMRVSGLEGVVLVRCHLKRKHSVLMHSAWPGGRGWSTRGESFRVDVNAPFEPYLVLAGPGEAQTLRRRQIFGLPVDYMDSTLPPLQGADEAFTRALAKQSAGRARSNEMMLAERRRRGVVA